MPLVTSKEMLLNAQNGNYAIGAFNVENMEMVKAVIATAEKMKAPVMLQTTPSTVKYASAKMFANMVKAEAESATVPVCIHLDHGSSYELAMSCVDNGYTSVMIDGSQSKFEENISITKKVVNDAHQKNISVEAELGKVGGKEDDHDSNGYSSTSPAEAKEFVERTGVDSLAVAIGTAHGVYVGVPVLDIERLSEIRKLVSIPLVLHGASGLSSQQIKDCVERGICKVNFATELRIAYTQAVRELLENDEKVIDPKQLGTVAMKAVSAIVKERMEVCGCVEKAK